MFTIAIDTKFINLINSMILSFIHRYMCFGNDVCHSQCFSLDEKICINTIVLLEISALRIKIFQLCYNS